MLHSGFFPKIKLGDGPAAGLPRFGFFYNLPIRVEMTYWDNNLEKYHIACIPLQLVFLHQWLQMRPGLFALCGFTEWVLYCINHTVCTVWCLFLALGINWNQLKPNSIIAIEKVNKILGFSLFSVIRLSAFWQRLLQLLSWVHLSVF